MVDCPYCHVWMPCKARIQMWRGEDYVTILWYTCEECGREYETNPDNSAGYLDKSRLTVRGSKI